MTGYYNQFLLVVLFGSILGTFSTLFAAFMLWIYTLPTVLRVYAPLLDSTGADATFPIKHPRLMVISSPEA